MPLTEQTLFGEYDKVKIAIERLRTYEPAEGYYLAFSGGKDSCVLLALAKEAGVKFDAHYNLTTVDPPELVMFIRREYPEVQIHYPPETMWRMIARKKTVPTRLVRFCCRALKERGGTGRLVLTGVRWEESVRRRARRMVETCNRTASKTYLHPIIDWTGGEVWQYIRERGVPYCSLYDEGMERIGCVMCPFGGPDGMRKDAERWPKISAAYRRACHRAVERGHAEGKPADWWQSGDDLYNWWISGGGDTRQESDQTVLFE